MVFKIKEQKNTDEIKKLEFENSLLKSSYAQLKKTTAKLEKEKERLDISNFQLNQAQKQAKIGSWTWDSVADKITWTKELYHIYGLDYRLPAPNYLNHLKLYSIQSRKVLDTAVKKSLKNGKSYEVELELFDTSKGEKWVICKGFALKDSNGQIAGQTGTVQDITESKKQRQIFRESELKYKIIAEKSKAVTMLTNLDGEATYISPNSISAFGWPANKLIGTTPNIFHPDDRVSVLNALRSAVKGSSRDNFRYRIIGNNKKIYWISHYWSPVMKAGKLDSVLSVLINIDEIKSKEQELEKKTFIIDNTLEGHALFVYKKNHKSKLTYVNKAWEDITGLKARDVLDKKEPLMFTSVKNKPEQKRRLYSKLDSGDFFQEDMEWVVADGKKIDVSVLSMPLRQDGVIVGWFITIRDITAQKTIEKKLKAEKNNVDQVVKERTSELRKQKLFSNTIIRNIPDMVFVKDAKNLRFELMNKAGETLLGVAEHELIGKSDYDFFPKSEADYFIEKDMETLKNRVLINTFDESIHTPQGIRFLHTKKIPIMDENGKPEFLLGISEDITEQKKLREELDNNAEEKFKLVFNSTTDAMFVSDMNTGKFILNNEAGKKMFGYTQEEIDKLTVLDLYPKETQVIVMDKSNLSEKIYKDLLVKRNDGSVFYADLNLSSITMQKNDYKMCIFRDVTKRREEENKFNQVKNDFLSMASHQLRTPLSATKWVLESLIDKNNIDPKQLEKFNDLIFSNERLIKLVNRLLSVARIESNRLVVDKKNTELKELIGRVVNDLKVISDQNGKEIKVSLPPDLKDVYCDPVLIGEALENLLSNAIAYSEESSVDIAVSIENREDDYLVSVHSKGYIEPSLLINIRKFNKFERGTGSAIRTPSGSGLGLYIVKRIVDASGGKFWVESNPETDTTFYFTIIKQKNDK